MEWLVVLGIVVVLTVVSKILGRVKNPDLSMSSKDIGKIADQMWKEWLDD
jgi:hypothetical protein